MLFQFFQVLVQQCERIFVNVEHDAAQVYCQCFFHGIIFYSVNIYPVRVSCPVRVGAANYFINRRDQVHPFGF